MKKFSLFLAVAFVAIAGALAQPSGKWVYVTESSNAKYWIAQEKDAMTLNPTEQTLDLWVKVEFNRVQPNGTTHQLGLQRFDLKTDEFAFREVIGYGANGQVLYHHRYDDAELNWQTPKMRSVAQELMSVAQATFASMTSQRVATTR